MGGCYYLIATADLTGGYDWGLHSNIERGGAKRIPPFEEIRNNAGTQFDPELVKVFIANAESWGEPGRSVDSCTDR